MALRTVAPSELVDASGSPRRFRVQSQPIAAYTSRLGLRHVGPDFEIDSFRPLSSLDEAGSHDTHPLTYLSSRRFASALVGRSGLTVVTRTDLQDCVPSGNAVVLTAEDPRNLFYAIMDSARSLELFECLETFRSTSATIAPTAVISSNVYVSDEAEIGPGVVILANTYVGPGVVVKPNAVIGGDGLEMSSGAGRHIVPHVGGVWLESGVNVGSCNCIDKGLFGDFTRIGSRSMFDNLVHVAHSVRLGSFCTLTACAEISGSAKLGDGVWLGPNTAINQGIVIGDHCFIGTGSVVIRDLQAHSLAYGSPAKFAGWVCECRTKLSFADDLAECAACAKKYVMDNGKVRRA